MKILVTGAEGFVGSWLVPRLATDGHIVCAAVRADLAGRGQIRPWPEGVTECAWDLTDGASVQALVDRELDAVIHLAAVASGADALRDPAEAWEINAAGAARLAQAVVERHGGAAGPLVLLASTAEVYGVGNATPRRETDPVAPVSPYAASKAGAELALLETGRRTGLRGVIARAFAHTGPGQDSRFVTPAFAGRIVAAKRAGATTVAVGNLGAVRELLHVRDVVDAYCRLLEKGVPGEIYNIAGGVGLSVAEVFDRLAALAGWQGRATVSPQFARPSDIPHLVGDGSKLRALTGWTPATSLEDTLAEVLRAASH